MGKLDEQLARDKALRDAARGAVVGDIEAIRDDLERKSVAERLTTRIGDSASAATGRVGHFAGANRTAIAALAGAAGLAGALWLARKPILKALDSFLGAECKNNGGEAPAGPPEDN